MFEGFSMKIDWKLIKPFGEKFNSSTYAMNTPSGCVLKTYDRPDSVPTFVFIPDVNVAYNEENDVYEFVCIIPMREEIRTLAIQRTIGCFEKLIEEYLKSQNIKSEPNTAKS